MPSPLYHDLRTARQRRYVTVPCSNPSHRDHRPSMSVNLATGRAFCFACGYAGKVSATLVERDHTRCPSLEVNIERLRARSAPCSDSLMAEVFLARRRIGIDTAGELGIRAVHLRGLDYIAFPYFREGVGEPSYYKLRPATGEKRPMYCLPAGQEPLLFNVRALDGLRHDEAPIIVEGELDVAALHQVGHFEAVSVPNGAFSRLTETVLRPLRRFAAITLGVDDDRPGDALAGRLCDALPGVSWRRIRWGGGHPS